ncbi:hypothetical protein Jorvik_08 [Rhodobacter phage Jorvik]|nr:hypothetical protein Jorvik_08 [Rhodobacter phage Jorvik]
MSKTVINLTVAVVLGTIATEMLMKKTPVGKMLGL